MIDSAYQHLYARLTTEATVTAITAQVFNYVPETAVPPWIFLGEPVVSEDRGTKDAGDQSQEVSIDLSLVVPRRGATSPVSRLAFLTSAVVGALHRYADPTDRAGYRLEIGEATLAARLDDDEDLVQVVSWIGLLRKV